MPKRIRSFIWLIVLTIFFLSCLFFIRKTEFSLGPYYKTSKVHNEGFTSVVQKIGWKQENDDFLLAGSKVSSVVLAQNNNLGIIFIPFNTHGKSINDEIFFRIRKFGDKDWYSEEGYKTNQIQDNIPFPFGFPIINNSKNKLYEFEIESLRGNAKEHVSIDKNIYIFVKFKFLKEDLIKNPLVLLDFAVAKFKGILSFYSSKEIFSSLLISIFASYLLYVIFQKSFRKIICNLYHSFKVGINETYEKIDDYLFAFFPLIIIFGLILHYGNLQFPGIDGGVLANAGWLMHTGQIPYDDFMTLVPPGFLIGAKWAYDIFGSSWDSQLIFLAIFSYVTYLIQYIILVRFGMSKRLSFVSALFIQLITNILITMWWYNSITTSCSALFISSAFLFYKNNKSVINSLIFVLTTFLLSLMKINIVSVLIVAVYLIFIISKKTRRLSIINGLISFVLLIVFLFFIRINPIDMLNAYINGTNRITLEAFETRLVVYEPVQSLGTLLLCAPFVVGLIALIDYIFSGKKQRYIIKKYGAYVVLTILGFFTCFWGLITDTDMRIIEFPAFFISSLLFIIIMRDKKCENILSSLSLSKILNLMMISVILLSIQSTLWTVFRRRVEASGDYYVKIYEKHNIGKITNKYFKNFFADDSFVDLVMDMERLGKILQQENKLNDYKLYFGSKVDFGYAMFNIKSPKGLPLWWSEASGGVPKGTTPTLIENFKKADFTVIVSRGGQLIYAPPELITELNNTYKVASFGNLVVWVNPHEEQLFELIKSKMPL
jgi:hypothetical protein